VCVCVEGGGVCVCVCVCVCYVLTCMHESVSDVCDISRSMYTGRKNVCFHPAPKHLVGGISPVFIYYNLCDLVWVGLALGQLLVGCCCLFVSGRWSCVIVYPLATLEHGQGFEEGLWSKQVSSLHPCVDVPVPLMTFNVCT
jgi:hypothetical protein